MPELIERFDLSSVHKSGAIFDIERLNFFNVHYLKNLDIDLIYDKFILFLKRYDSKFLDKILKFGKNYNKKILNELRTKIKKFDEYKDLTNFFYNDSKIPSNELLLNEKMKIFTNDDVKKSLNIALEILENNNDFDNIDNLKNLFIEKINNS
jgi:glutamyl/glutaminyl-tRNA synthetase